MPNQNTPPADRAAAEHVDVATAPVAASPTTSSRLGADPPSPTWVNQEKATAEQSHGAAGLEIPFELREVNGETFPVWKDSGRVPLRAIRNVVGKQEGDSFGAEPEAALRLLQAKEAELDGRATDRVGVGSLGRFVPGGVQKRLVSSARIGPDGRDENGDIVEQGRVSKTSLLRDDGAVVVAPDGRDAHGRVLVDVGGPPSFPGRGEPLPSGSGPQPAKVSNPDSRVNASPESKVIPPLGEDGTDKAASLKTTTLTDDERRDLSKIAKGEVVKAEVDAKLAEQKSGGPNETAAREKGSDHRGKTSGRDA